jgi:PleD family two-component response regulator
VPNAAQINVVSRHRRNAPDRRVLIVAASPAGVALPVQLAGAGYDARVVDAERASQAIAEFAPHVMLIETGAGEFSAGKLELARRLRAGRATSALPLVLLFEHDDADLRASALAAGADDYFALATPPAEIAARLDALFWRMEAGRRTASLAALEQRAEIDNFLQLLDAVRADIDEDAIGVLALIAPRGGTAEEDRTLAAAYDFFKLNLRRLDSIAFYGPTLLLVYLPHRTANAAHAALARVSDEFAQTQAGVPLKIGLASFPANGTEIENLIEHAELSLSSSASQDSTQQHTIENSLVDLPATESSISNSAPPPPSTARVSTAATRRQMLNNSLVLLSLQSELCANRNRRTTWKLPSCLRAERRA